MAWAAAIGAASSILGRRSAKKQAARERRNAIEDQINSLPRLRESAEKAGFNPLSALMAGGAGSFGAGLPSGSVAPLASQSVLQGAVRDVADYLRPSDPDEDLRREMNKTNLALAKLKLEKAQAGNAGEVVARTPSLGRRPLPAGSVASDIDFDVKEPGRETDVEEVKSKPGYFALQSRLTLGHRVYALGEEMESDPISMAWTAAQVAPQIAGHEFVKMRNLDEETREYLKQKDAEEIEKLNRKYKVKK